MFTPNRLRFHYENLLRQDLLLKLNYGNIMEVPRLCTTFDAGNKLSYFLMIYSGTTNDIGLEAKNANCRRDLKSNLMAIDGLLFHDKTLENPYVFRNITTFFDHVMLFSLCTNFHLILLVLSSNGYLFKYLDSTLRFSTR